MNKTTTAEGLTDAEKIAEAKKILNRERCRRWREKNREKANAYRRKWYEQHKKHAQAYYRDYQKQWRKDNPEKEKQYNDRYYLRKYDEIFSTAGSEPSV